MDVPIETLACLLDDSWDAAPTAANTLRQQLRTFETSLSAQFRGTGVIASVSKNSASQSYRGAALGSLTVPQVQQGFRTLIVMYDQTNNYCQWANANESWFQTTYPGYANDNDSAVYPIMQAWLQNDFTQFQTDMTYLRLAPTLYPQGCVTA
jgi:hypothetical protein